MITQLEKTGGRKDIMVDIETLGKKSSSTIFQIAAVSFDITSGEIYSSFNHIADIEDNRMLNVDGSTLKWWLKTDIALLNKLLNKGEGSSEQLLFDFHDWLSNQSEDERDTYL